MAFANLGTAFALLMGMSIHLSAEFWSGTLERCRAELLALPSRPRLSLLLGLLFR